MEDLSVKLEELVGELDGDRGGGVSRTGRSQGVFGGAHDGVGAGGGGGGRGGARVAAKINELWAVIGHKKSIKDALGGVSDLSSEWAVADEQGLQQIMNVRSCPFLVPSACALIWLSVASHSRSSPSSKGAWIISRASYGNRRGISRS